MLTNCSSNLTDPAMAPCSPFRSGHTGHGELDSHRHDAAARRRAGRGWPGRRLLLPGPGGQGQEEAHEVPLPQVLRHRARRQVPHLQALQEELLHDHCHG